MKQDEGGNGEPVCASSTLTVVATLALFGLCLASGCGEAVAPTYPVTGQVVFPDGTPLASGGSVVFTNLEASPPITAKGYFEADGRFELTTFRPGDGAIAGEHHVVVHPSVPDDRPPGMSPAQYIRAMDPIDDRFKSAKRSGLLFVVSPDTAPHDFRIEVTRPSRRR